MDFLADFKKTSYFCSEIKEYKIWQNTLILSPTSVSRESSDRSCRNLYLLKNMETLNRLPWAAQSAVFQKLESIADVGGMTRAERLQYDEALKKYRDTISVFEGVRLEGRMEGNAEGRANEKKNTVKRLLASGASVDIIAVATGLAHDEVKVLIDEISIE